MEDSNKMKAQPKNSTQNTDRVIDLTPEMETGDGRKAKIIELTQALGTPPASPQRAPRPAPAPPADSADDPAAPQPVDSANIEADVDAAFDAMHAHAKNNTDGDTAMALSRIAESDPFKPVSTVEPELELSIDDLAEEADPPPPDAPCESTAGGSADATDDFLELTDLVLDAPTAAAQGGSEGIERTDPDDPLKDDPALSSAAPDTTDEDDPIDLTDIVLDESPAAPGREEDDVIELADVVQPASAADDEQDEVIELIDIVDPDELAAGGQEQDVIALTDIVQPASAADGEQDGAIELTDIVDPDELAAGGQEQDVIELNDMVLTDEPEEMSFSGEPELLDLEEEDLIEPADTVDADGAVPPTATAEAGEEDLSAHAGPEHEAAGVPVDAYENESPDNGSGEADQPFAAAGHRHDDQVIRLDSVLNQLRKNKSSLTHDISSDIGGVLSGGMDGSGDFSAGSNIEKAVERVLEAKYGQTIEALIASVVEKVVTREIESIKRNLMEGDE